MALDRKYDTLLLSSVDDGTIVTVTLNRPRKLNAMTVELMTELYEALDLLEFDDKVRVIIITGSGKGFSAGADLMANARGIGGVQWDSSRMSSQERFSRVITKIARLPQTVIAAVHGASAGAGFSLALAADMRIAGESAKMSAAFIQIGLSGCEMGTSYFLPKLVGTSNAAEIMMTGDVVTAQRALQLGIVSSVVPDAEIVDAALVLARKCCRASWLGLRLTKQQLRSASDGMSLHAAIHAEDKSQVLCINDSETKVFIDAKLDSFLPKPKL